MSLSYTSLETFQEATRNGPHTFTFYMKKRYIREAEKEIKKVMDKIILPNFKVLDQQLTVSEKEHIPHKNYYCGRHGESDEDSEESYDMIKYCFMIRLEDPLAKYRVAKPAPPKDDDPIQVAERLKNLLKREAIVGVVWGKTIDAKLAEKCSKVCTTTIPVLSAVVLAEALSTLDKWNITYTAISGEKPHDFIIFQNDE